MAGDHGGPTWEGDRHARVLPCAELEIHSSEESEHVSTATGECEGRGSRGRRVHQLRPVTKEAGPTPISRRRVRQSIREDEGSTAQKVMFTSEQIENIPAGFRARETYVVIGPDAFEEVFELAEPGKSFETYSHARFTRIKAGARDDLTATVPGRLSGARESDTPGSRESPRWRLRPSNSSERALLLLSAPRRNGSNDAGLASLTYRAAPHCA